MTFNCQFATYSADDRLCAHCDMDKKIASPTERTVGPAEKGAHDQIHQFADAYKKNSGGIPDPDTFKTQRGNCTAAYKSLHLDDATTSECAHTNIVDTLNEISNRLKNFKIPSVGPNQKTFISNRREESMKICREFLAEIETIDAM